ncbi:unnamed protein product [Caenorhabditis auriculariae]|uniref:Uncharacterized protein n=1 Tax=Caenorhabditis auriculariae TaxID=2777116 RepID=A0A8S1HG76_9PELO|nr:unnamed protein product [Caenorhabditis auriculariae]
MPNILQFENNAMTMNRQRPAHRFLKSEVEADGSVPPGDSLNDSLYPSSYSTSGTRNKSMTAIRNARRRFPIERPRLMRVAVLLTLLLGASAFPEPGEENVSVARRVQLKFPSSFLNLTSDAWKVKENEDEVMVAAQLQARTAVGQVFSLRFISNDGALIAKVTVGVLAGDLQVDAFDVTGATILNKPIGNQPINLNNQNMAININTTTGVLTVRMTPQTDLHYEFSRSLNLGGSTLVVTLGGGDRSIVGCVSLIAVSVGGGDPVAGVVEVENRDIEECPMDEADQTCESMNCNSGTCIMEEVATCNCYGTSFTGPNCRIPARTAKIRNSDDEDSSFVAFIPWPEDREIEMIAMDFKFGSAEAKEGVLIHGIAEPEEHFKVYVVDTKGNVVLGNETLLNFAFSDQEDFHRTIISFDSTFLTFEVDGTKQKVTLKRRLSFKTVQFGAPLPSEGASEVGITACLKNTYVDHHDVIHLMYEKDPKILATRLRPCVQGDDFVSDLQAVSLFDPDPIVQTNEESKKVNENKSPVNAVLFPHPATQEEAKGKAAVPCEKSQSYRCQNGADCEKLADEGFVCKCPHGFVGRFCQFVTFPRSCSEARDFHGLPNGPTRLDVDGSSSAEPNVVFCVNGTTIVQHDMKPETVARSSDFHDHSLFILSYRDFKPSQLTKLVESSSECRQNVSYSCNKAPLRFENGHTWFESSSAPEEKITQIGNVPQSCSCIDAGCLSGGKCNCDSGAISEDTGVLKGSNAGITKVVALHNDGDVQGAFSIGRLECSGYGMDNKPVRFVEKTSIMINEWEGKDAYVHFRTNDKDVTLFYVEKDGREVLRAHLKDGHALVLLYEGKSLRLESQKRLNDSAWHQIIVEVSEGQVRFGVDGLNEVGDVEGSLDGRFFLNDNQRGFVGCARSLRLNGQWQPLQELARDYSTVKTTCDDHCAKQTCVNDARCHVDFVNEKSFCMCSYPEIHSGPNCEIDINSNSSVSFHGGYIKYEDVGNALLSTTYFSFRTDQPLALLLFSHDHNNNFLQVHLSDEVNISLTLNNENVVATCTVRARLGQEYSDMRWIQVVVSHGSEASMLRVGDEVCSIREKRSLAVKPIRRFSNVQTDVVELPVGLSSSVNPTPFVFTFIGGVDQGSPSRDGSLVLAPRYETTIPKLLGCVRGLQIGGEFVDLRNRERGTRPLDKLLVRTGCDVRCAEVDCRNGGHCSVGWRNYDPTVSKTTCDCSRTSYAGPSCTVDEGIRVSAGGWLNFDVGRELSRVFVQETGIAQLFQFAFAVPSPPTAKQRIVLIKFSDGGEFDVQLNKNGTINVGILNSKGHAEVLNFNGNFSDGYRHFLVAQCNPLSATAILLDSIRQDFPFKPNGENLDLLKATSVKIAGNVTSRDKLLPFQTFDGYVTNVVLDYQHGSKLRFVPISYIDDVSHEMHGVVTSHGVVKSACPSFRVPNSIPAYQNLIEMPEWDTDFRRHVYHGAVEDDSKNTREPSSFLWVLLTIVFLIALTLLVFCICRRCCCRESARATAMTQDEDEPLNGKKPTSYYPPQPSPPPRHNPAPSNYHLPPPNVDFNREDEKAHSPRASLTSSGITGYFTAQESPSDGDEVDVDSDEERTIRHIDDDADSIVYVSRPNDTERALRMSSFGHADPTAPQNSPLYANVFPLKELKPVSVPVPPPRFSPNHP